MVIDRLGHWPRVRAGACLALVLVASPVLAGMGTSTASHAVTCLLVDGRQLVLGNAGAAGPNVRAVTCSVAFDQVRPRRDGVVLVLRAASHQIVFSLVADDFRPAATSPIVWLHRTSLPTVPCTLAAGRLYLGATGPPSGRTPSTCAVRFEQLSPYADGVVVVLANAGHQTKYTVAMHQFSQRPSGYTRIPWSS